MTSPFAVIPNPADESRHLLFFLAGTSQQLAVEVRPQAQTQSWPKYTANKVPQGVIANPTALAVTTLNGVVTVYGLATIAETTSSSASYVSTLSPVFNPISTDRSAVSAATSLAACANSDGTANYVYYLTSDKVNYYIQEFQVDGVTTQADPAWTNSVPSPNTQLAAITFQSTGDRYVIYANTDGNNENYGLYCISSKDKTRKSPGCGPARERDAIIQHAHGLQLTGLCLQPFSSVPARIYALQAR
jgi:hypothetical protein